MEYEKVITFIRQNLWAFLIGTGIFSAYALFTLTGRECLNCEQTEVYKPGQGTRSGVHFRHK